MLYVLSIIPPSDTARTRFQFKFCNPICSPCHNYGFKKIPRVTVNCENNLRMPFQLSNDCNPSLVKKN